MSLERLTEKKDEKPAPGGRPGSPRRSRPGSGDTESSTVTRSPRKQRDNPVMAAANHFAQRAEYEGLQLAKGPMIIYFDLNRRVDASGIRKIKDPATGKELVWSNGKRVWPDLLLGMVDEFFDSEYRHGDKWCWQEFCGVETFGRLMDYLVWKMIRQRDKVTYDARSAAMNAELEAGWHEIEAAMRSENEQRQRDTDQDTDHGNAVPSVVETAADLFGDDLDEYERLRAKRQQKLERSAKRAQRKNQRHATDEGDN